MGSFQDSLLYALGAGEKFDVNGNTEYIATIICEFVEINMYIDYIQESI